MQIISSKDNRIIKEAASLSEKKYRDKLGLYLLEGPNIVKEAMEEGGRVRFIFTRAGADSEEISGILRKASEDGPAVFELTTDVFAKVTHTDSPQDIAAVFEKRQIEAEEFFKITENGNLIVLDRLQDPGNVGTIIRTAEAFGFAGIICIRGTADIYQPKVVRSAAGSILRLPVLMCEDADEAMTLLKVHNYRLYAAAMNGSINVYDADLRDTAAVVIGNEGNGISKAFYDHANLMSIPMDGKTESLNAAIAAATIMYESLRQRRK